MRRYLTLFTTFISLSLAAQNPPSTPAVPPASSAASTAWPTAQFAATAAKDPSVQKAKQVLDDMIKALGGDAYLNVHQMSSEGRSYAFWQGRPSGMGVLYWRFWEWPDKDRVELTKQRDVIELNLGDKGYEITYKGTGTQDPKQLEDYNRRRAHSLETVIREWLPAKGTMILYSGTAIVEQNLADQVTVLNGDNDSVMLSVDPNSHLPVKKTFSWRDPADRQMNEEGEIFSNYRLVQGIQTPFSVVRTANGEMRSQRFVTQVTYNNTVPASMFETKGITYNPQKQGNSPPPSQ